MGLGLPCRVRERLRTSENEPSSGDGQRIGGRSRVRVERRRAVLAARPAPPQMTRLDRPRCSSRPGRVDWTGRRSRRRCPITMSSAAAIDATRSARRRRRLIQIDGWCTVAAGAAPIAAAMAASRCALDGRSTGRSDRVPGRSQLGEACGQHGVGVDTRHLARRWLRRRGQRTRARRRRSRSWSRDLTIVGGLRVPGEVSSHRRPPAGDPRADGTGRHAQHLGDLGVVERADVAQHDRGAELERQRRERVVDDQPVGDAARRGRPRPSAGTMSSSTGTGRRRRRRSSSRQALVATRYDHVANDERPSKRGRPAHERDQRLLGRVEGVGVVAGQAPAQPVQAVVVAAQQRVERRLIAGLSGGDEGDVVRSADGRNATSRLDAGARRSGRGRVPTSRRCRHRDR